MTRRINRMLYVAHYVQHVLYYVRMHKDYEGGVWGDSKLLWFALVCH